MRGWSGDKECRRWKENRNNSDQLLALCSDAIRHHSSLTSPGRVRVQVCGDNNLKGEERWVVRARVCVYESGSSSHQYPPALVEKNRQARSKLTEIPSDMRMKGEKKENWSVSQLSDDSIPTQSDKGGGVDGWMDERMNGRAAFEYLLLTVQATADLASGNRWELWRCGWLGQGGRKWRMNYGWTDEVRGRGGGRGGGLGVSGEDLCPADRQAASRWSRLATQSQAEMTVHLCICSVQRLPGWF